MVKHRLRMCALYHRAEQDGRLVAGCLNRTEWITGFFVRCGDTAAGPGDGAGKHSAEAGVFPDLVDGMAGRVSAAEHWRRDPPFPGL